MFVVNHPDKVSGLSLEDRKTLSINLHPEVLAKNLGSLMSLDIR
jgi:hypothetical protein